MLFSFKSLLGFIFLIYIKGKSLNMPNRFIDHKKLVVIEKRLFMAFDLFDLCGEFSGCQHGINNMDNSVRAHYVRYENIGFIHLYDVSVLR